MRVHGWSGESPIAVLQALEWPVHPFEAKRPPHGLSLGRGNGLLAGIE